jgi:hypothetical protein
MFEAAPLLFSTLMSFIAYLVSLFVQTITNQSRFWIVVGTFVIAWVFAVFINPLTKK